MFVHTTLPVGIIILFFAVRPNPVRHLDEFNASDGPAYDADQIPDPGGRNIQALAQPVFRRHRSFSRQSGNY